eukprot:PRCOL_00005073-RA
MGAGDVEGAARAPAALAAASWEAASARAAAARASLHRPAAAAAHSAAAAQLDAEAATWALVDALYCSPESERRAALSPGATVAEAACVAARAREGQPSLWRPARAVAWLEGLARHRLEMVARDAGVRVDQPSALPAFVWGGRDAAWVEDLLAEGDAARVEPADAGGLDPDGVRRGARAPPAEHEGAEAALLRGVWMFVRCGMVAEACALCALGGQPWRAASLAACGLGGPTPLGDSALAAVVADASTAFVEEMDGGAPLRRRRCAKRAALAAARSLAAEASAAGSGSAAALEGALYGAQAADLAAMLPVCLTWEEAAWARLKCWVDLRVDDALEALFLRDGGADEMIAAADDDLEGGGAFGGRPSSEWPTHDVRSQVPAGEDPAADVFRCLADDAVSGAAIAAEGGSLQRVVQRAIVEEDWEGLVGALSEELRRDEAAAAARGGAHAPGAAERARFSAHLVLSFRALARRLAAAGDAGDEGDRGLMHFLQGGAFALDVDNIVTNYVLHLMEAEEYLVLVSYLAWVAPDAREATFVGFLGRLAEAPLEDKRAIYDEARPLFEPSARDIGSAASGAIRAANELRAAAPPGGVGVARKRAAGEWLVCAPELRAHALCYACAVLRELALGGEASKAAKRVLADLATLAREDDDLGEDVLSRGVLMDEDGVGASPGEGGERPTPPEGMDAFEAQAWQQYFECQAALEELAEVESKRELDEDGKPSAMWAEALALAAGAALAATTGLLEVSCASSSSSSSSSEARAMLGGGGDGGGGGGVPPVGGGWLVYPGEEKGVGGDAAASSKEGVVELELLLAAPPGCALDAVREACLSECARAAALANVRVLHAGAPEDGGGEALRAEAAAGGWHGGALCRVHLRRMLLEVAEARGETPSRAPRGERVVSLVAEDAGGMLALFARGEMRELLRAEQACAVLCMP